MARSIGPATSNGKKLTKTDLDKGLDIYLKNEDIQNRKSKEELNKMISSIYI